ncbi:MAG: sigma 54-interacting transcriptional regulator [Bacteriovoracaceae bacterium]|jgi:transcriptional regulator with PAS, ATPase and Fis domain|nr:sigma 54-interacting transcriptional regulator [Bacteriovoracaceae bacterium]
MLKRHQLNQINSSLLLLGKPGAGKSYLAKIVHEESSRKDHPFVHVNICALNKETFESELFGHVKGSFTGAINDNEGYLGRVNKGTLFLDEIGDLSLELQSKVLMLLEEKIYYRVGSSRPIKFEGSIILATNKNLEQMVKENQFRDDLHSRISFFNYKVPTFSSNKNKKQIINRIICDLKNKSSSDFFFEKEALEFIYNLELGGNIRELKNILEYLVLFNKHIRICDVKAILEAKDKSLIDYDDYYEHLGVFEKEFLMKKLQKYDYGINLTAKKTNISKVTLISKIKKYGINIKELKENRLVS